MYPFSGLLMKIQIPVIKQTLKPMNSHDSVRMHVHVHLVHKHKAHKAGRHSGVSRRGHQHQLSAELCGYHLIARQLYSKKTTQSTNFQQ
jgi:hypothetical protein